MPTKIERNKGDFFIEDDFEFGSIKEEKLFDLFTHNCTSIFWSFFEYNPSFINIWMRYKFEDTFYHMHGTNPPPEILLFFYLPFLHHDMAINIDFVLYFFYYFTNPFHCSCIFLCQK